MKPDTLIAMALYRPHPGQEDELLKILQNHVPTLRKEGLVTDRSVLLLKAQDGTFIEIFQWESEDAKDRAHKLPSIREIWSKMMEIADFPSLSSLPEAANPFPNFKLV
jgi:quinol monooxygenase YgiN